MQWTVGKLIEASGGRLLQGDPSAAVGNVSTDTRSLVAGDCFVALCGENHDGHHFVPGALEKGAGAVVVAQKRAPCDFAATSAAVIEVADTLHALGQLASYVRGQYQIPVVGITGSNGKTSTKEMLAGILGKNKKVLKNQGNFNNLIGAPLTLLSLDAHHEAAVVEMGINVPGEMARLLDICRPTVGLVTNVHPAHLEGLKSVDNILEEKGRLLTSLGADDLAVVNLDDERLARLSNTLGSRMVTYSRANQSAQVRVLGDVKTTHEMSIFRMGLGEREVSIRLPVLGLHQVQNGLASAAAAWGMGESPESIAEALCTHQPVRQRMQVHRLPDGRTLIDDTYNANPRSMAAAVSTALSCSRGKPVVAVLGEMRELGEGSAALHREVGREIGGMGLYRLVTLGDKAAEIVAGAVEAGMEPSACFHAQSHDEAVVRLRESVSEEEWIVVKGSRGMRMELVVEGIMA